MWLEYFAGTENGDLVANVIKNTDKLIVPTITIYEVFKKLLLERTEKEALFFISHMKQGNVISLTDELSLYAAKIGKEHKLPMADSIIYATNITYNCVLWTQDKHFSGLQSVNYLDKRGVANTQELDLN
jgi:predicted nucleic acid-binding protein